MAMNKKHPADVGLSYLAHLKFTWSEMIRLAGMEFVMFVHGLIPWVWDHKFSNYIKNTQERINRVSETTPKAWGDSSTTANME